MTGYQWRGQPAATPGCGCGCGEPVTIATKSDSRYGRVKGQPNRYVQGHHPVSPAQRAALERGWAARPAGGKPRDGSP